GPNSAPAGSPGPTNAGATSSNAGACSDACSRVDPGPTAPASASSRRHPGTNPGGCPPGCPQAGSAHLSKAAAHP
ncbi:MAG: hypothetical protein ACNA74_05980, partial [Desulfurivibrio sp.]